MNWIFARGAMRSRRGSVLIEFAFAAGFIVPIVFAVAMFAGEGASASRDARAVRSALELAVALDRERLGAMSVGDFAAISGLAESLASDGDWSVHASAFEADATGSAVRSWSGSQGALPSRAGPAGGAEFVVDGSIYTILAGETAIIVEIVRSGDADERYRKAIVFVPEAV